MIIATLNLSCINPKRISTPLKEPQIFEKEPQKRLLHPEAGRVRHTASVAHCLGVACLVPPWQTCVGSSACEAADAYGNRSGGCFYILGSISWVSENTIPAVLGSTWGLLIFGNSRGVTEDVSQNAPG